MRHYGNLTNYQPLTSFLWLGYLGTISLNRSSFSSTRYTSLSAISSSICLVKWYPDTEKRSSPFLLVAWHPPFDLSVTWSCLPGRSPWQYPWRCTEYPTCPLRSLSLLRLSQQTYWGCQYHSRHPVLLCLWTGPRFWQCNHDSTQSELYPVIKDMIYFLVYGSAINVQ